MLTFCARFLYLYAYKVIKNKNTNILEVCKMSAKDYGPHRPVYEHGWQFKGIVRSPYEKKDFTPNAPDNRSLTAAFEYVATRDGRQLDVSKWMTPHQRFLTQAEIDEGFQARVHGIPPKLIEKGRNELLLAQAPQVVIIARAPKLVA
ncbi:MAG: hypothetical protein DI626_11530 [Micavibrio aeruginosavorus]|uniref:Uncharacterized protein n=1 Tax=Micavibrio aeruginosavorus TaxID=349221 RepID=A0A2W5BEZ2_9BACT|nr:MAG: hypothetical protein DI626_11530 [Micavibrio aeruginosavorus]